MNLTRDEAQARARVVTADAYDVVLDLTAGDKVFGSTTSLGFGCDEPGAETFLDLVAETVESISLNGRELDPAEVYDGTRIRLTDLQERNEVVVVAQCRYMHTGEGLHRFVDPVDDAVYLYSQFEVADSRRVFAAFEQPDLKATFTFTVTAPADWVVVSNNPSTVEDGRATTGGPARVWSFSTTPRISSYITAIVAGPYHEVRSEHRSSSGRTIPLGLYCRRSLAEHLDADALFEVTRQGFEFFERVFDYPYPFEKYDQLFVPEFNAGAMENAGCVTHHEDYVFRSKVPEAYYERRAETVLHEMAHMWFGDLVTMTWWDDLWLNESFATYASVLCQAEVTQWRSAWTTFANAEKTWAYRQDQLPSTHPVVADINDLEDVEVNFDGITYAKGASVLKQLVAWVGHEHFEEGLRRYFRSFEWGNTTLADLLGKLEETSGRNLKTWSAEWLETAGVNTLRPRFEVDADGRFTSFEVLQEAADDWPTLRSHRLAVGLYDRRDGRLERRSRFELDVSGARTAVPDLVGEKQPDLVLLNDDDLTYAKIRLDDRSRATVVDAVGEFTDSLPRSLCWVSAWDMTRDAELPATQFVDLVLSGIAHETDSSVVRTLLAQLDAAVSLYAAPDHRPELARRLVARLRELLEQASPGSDAQLQLLRAFAASARSADDLAFVRALLDGQRSLEGVTVDTDLRWALVHALVGSGAAGEELVDAELDRDPTATGQRHAASARAARPERAAKDEAWHRAVQTDELPNAILSATVGGFARTGQEDLLREYVAPYFAAIGDVWANRTNDTAQTIVVGLYPRLLAEPATLESSDRWLAENASAAPALRRLVVEGRDAVARALRAQACDAAG